MGLWDIPWISVASLGSPVPESPSCSLDAGEETILGSLWNLLGKGVPSRPSLCSHVSGDRDSMSFTATRRVRRLCLLLSVCPHTCSVPWYCCCWHFELRQWRRTVRGGSAHREMQGRLVSGPSALDQTQPKGGFSEGTETRSLWAKPIKCQVFNSVSISTTLTKVH